MTCSSESLRFVLVDGGTGGDESDESEILGEFWAPQKVDEGKNGTPNFSPHRIHVWYIYLHLVHFYGKCR